MKKLFMLVILVLAFSTINVNAEEYKFKERDGFFVKEETITVEDSLTEEMLEETYGDNSHWWDFLGDFFHKEETITVW